MSLAQRRILAYFRYLARSDSPLRLEEFYDRPRAEGIHFTQKMYSAVLYGTSHGVLHTDFVNRVLVDMTAEGYILVAEDYKCLIRAAYRRRDLQSGLRNFRALEIT